jgi:beta-N-acetylhexosaminidase
MFRLIFTLVLSLSIIGSAGFGIEPSSADLLMAEDILESMSPEERVGQLFLVTFQGDKVDEESPIYDLIFNHHISGVLLQRGNDNFTEQPDTIANTKLLIESLQDTEYEASQNASSSEPENTDEGSRVYIPLFIATTHEGGGTKYSEILSGLTEQPTEMAIGATWDTNSAFSAGEVLGRELEALGFNLYLGPSLDVLEEPQIIDVGGIGVRSFGGDPFWVSEMGKAYIQGLHEGSNQRLGVVAKHFPGLGGADRPIKDEVATVRKSLEQLKQIELAPFFAVTGMVPGEASEITDGLLTTHIRYQGFQGNIRATTRPISLDPQAFAQLMDLDPLSAWRAGGGIAVSDSLGSRAVRRFTDPLEWTFKAHLVARDAFIAGNDLLLLSNFKSSEEPDELSTIKATLAFFAKKYQEDATFAQRVDESVLRILRLKLRIYRDAFTRVRVRPSDSALIQIGEGQETVFPIAQSAASLISPGHDEVEDRQGGTPTLGERIVFFTDARFEKQCTTCEREPVIAVDELEKTVLQLYGQTAAGQVGSWNLQSFSMADLANYLDVPPKNTPDTPLTPADQLEEPLLSAEWLVFSILNTTDDAYGSNALKLLLDQRPDLARSKRLVVFAFDIPYNLDATDISKVDVYYALSSSGYAYVDVAAHLLFMELSAPGDAPVSIPGIGYNLIEATSPDPEQVISLTALPVDDEASESEGVPEFFVGDQIQVRTGVVLDRNAHPVPDGTVVEFILNQQGENILSYSTDAITTGGVAVIGIALDRLGLISITARSDPARISDTLQINVQEDIPVQATVISPTLIPTVTIEPTQEPVEPTPTVVTDYGEITSGFTEDQVGAIDFLFGILVIGGIASIGYWSTLHKALDTEQRARYILLTAICGLIGYNYVALNLPGSATLQQTLGVVAAILLAIGGSLIGLIAASLWVTLES